MQIRAVAGSVPLHGGGTAGALLLSPEAGKGLKALPRVLDRSKKPFRRLLLRDQDRLSARCDRFRLCYRRRATAQTWAEPAAISGHAEALLQSCGSDSAVHGTHVAQAYAGLVTHLTVGLDDAEAAELAAEASRQGLQADELAHRALVDYLQRSRVTAERLGPKDTVPSFVGMMASEKLRGESADELLAGGFGR